MTRVSTGLASGGARLDRAHITYRASRVMLAAREPRLQTFARSLADAALHDDLWAERIGSVVVSKPPSQWTVMDQDKAMDEIDLLTDAFNRTEATAFGKDMQFPDLTALRIAVTAADGHEAAHIVRVLSEDETSVQKLSEQLRAALNGTERADIRLAAIAQLLKNDLLSELKTAKYPEEPI